MAVVVTWVVDGIGFLLDCTRCADGGLAEKLAEIFVCIEQLYVERSSRGLGPDRVTHMSILVSSSW